MHMIDPRALDIFRAVAVHGSATRAADALNMTQPNVTRLIAAFEAQCGFKLFERGRHGMTLTAEGDVLLASVERSFAGLNAVGRAVADIRQGRHGSLWTIAVPVIAETMLGDLIGTFMRDHPQVSVNFCVSPPEDVIRNVALGEVDLGAVVGVPPTDDDLHAIPIGSRQLSAVVAPHHRLANRDRLHFRELAGESFVVMARPHNIHLAVEQLMRDFGIRPPVLHQASTQRSVVELVRRCDAVGFVDRELGVAVPDGTITCLDLDPPTVWTVNLIHRRAEQQSAVLKGFLRWLAPRLATQARAAPAS